MLLKDLLIGIYDQPLGGAYADYEIFDLSCDSRDIKPDSLFVALSGLQFNGQDFIRDAISRGAKVVVRGKTSEDELADDFPADILMLEVENPKKFLYEIAARFYGRPCDKVKVFGITGTNGKTTITYLLESIAQQFQKQCAVVGTINYRVGREVLPSRNTTPSFLDNQKFLTRLSVQNVDYSFM